jgi:hypothetical protein
MSYAPEPTTAPLPWAEEWIAWTTMRHWLNGNGPSDADPGDEATEPRYPILIGVDLASSPDWTGIMKIPSEYLEQKLAGGLLRMDGIKDF